MDNERRKFLAIFSTLSIASFIPHNRSQKNTSNMYGLISKIKVATGKREKLAAILLGGISGMPGCLSYVVAADTTEEDAIWTTEVWDSKASHEASLSLPSVQEAITLGRPLIVGFDARHETEPYGELELGSPD